MLPCQVQESKSQVQESQAKTFYLLVMKRFWINGSLFSPLRNKDGSEYPPATVHVLLCGLQRIMHCESGQPFEIFAKGYVITLTV